MAKGAKTNQTVSVKAGPVYTPQTDPIYDFSLKKPRTTLGDRCLLAFCAWNFVVIGAVLGQYVADMFLYYWFLATLVAVNCALMAVLGTPLLWGQYFKRDMKASMRKVAVSAGVMVAVMLVMWGCWTLTLLFMDFTVVGHLSLPFPLMTSTWQVALYWTGLILSGVMWAVVESVWWNLGYDGLANQNMILRLWAFVCCTACGWCLTDPMMKGTWGWYWQMVSGLMGGVICLASFFVYDFASLGGAVGLRLGWWLGNMLVWASVYWSWWPRRWAAIHHTYNWTPGNLFNLGIQNTEAGGRPAF